MGQPHKGERTQSQKLIRDRQAFVTDILPNGLSISQYALRNASPSVCAWILSMGADAHEIDESGRNTLSYLLKYDERHLPTAWLLVAQYGVDPTTMDAYSRAV